MSTVKDVVARVDTVPALAHDVENAAQECVTFRLGHEEYAIDILCVQEIRSYESPTQIPNAPPHIKGVVNLRGVIVPILDLRLKFSLDSVHYDDSTVVIVLNIAKRTVGIVVDAVSDVLEIGPADRKPAPEFSTSLDTSFITGIASIDAEAGMRMLILLDIERLLAGTEIGSIG